MANSDLKYLNVQLIVDWVNENRVFESIYTSQNNSYIVQRSSDFLKFMLDEKLVSMQQLEMIVKSAKKGEIEDKQAIYKVLAAYRFVRS
jgi:ubiquitin carboxyl-terminal hydrolase 34